MPPRRFPIVRVSRPRRIRGEAAPLVRLKNSQLDVQEFLRIGAEVPDQQAHVPRQSRPIVIEFRIGEKFAHGALARIEFRGGVAHVRRSVAQIREDRIIRRQLPESSFARADIAKKARQFGS